MNVFRFEPLLLLFLRLIQDLLIVIQDPEINELIDR